MVLLSQLNYWTRPRPGRGLVGNDPVALTSDLVIVSAGALGSPGVLMRSGIALGDHLAELGITTALDLRGVAATLRDHCGISVVFRPSSELSEHSSASTQSADAR